MHKNLTVGAVIPAHNEADNIGAVVTGLLDRERKPDTVSLTTS